MILVSDIIKTKDAELFNKCKKLFYVLDIVDGPSVKSINRDFSSSVVHSEILTPVAYSNDREKLETYAKNQNLKNYKINLNPCKC